MAHSSEHSSLLPSSATSVSPSSNAELRALLTALGNSDPGPSLNPGSNTQVQGRLETNDTVDEPVPKIAEVGSGMEAFLDLGAYDGDSSTPSFSTFPYSPFSLPSPSPDPSSHSHPETNTGGTPTASSSSYPHTPTVYSSAGSEYGDRKEKDGRRYGTGSGGAEEGSFGTGYEFGSPLGMGTYGFLPSPNLLGNRPSLPPTGLGASAQPQPGTISKSNSYSSTGSKASTGFASSFSLMGDIEYETVDFAEMGNGEGLFPLGGIGSGGSPSLGGRQPGSGPGEGTMNPFELSPGAGGALGLDASGERNGSVPSGSQMFPGQDFETGTTYSTQTQAQTQAQPSGPALTLPQAQAQTLNYSDFLQALYKATQAQIAAGGGTGTGITPTFTNPFSGPALALGGIGAGTTTSPFYAALNPEAVAAPSLPTSAAGETLGSAPVGNAIGFTPLPVSDLGMDFGLPLSPPYYEMTNGATLPTASDKIDKGARRPGDAQSTEGMSPLHLEDTHAGMDENMDQDEEEDDEEDDDQEDLVRVKEEPMDLAFSARSTGSVDRAHSEALSHSSSLPEIGSIAARPLPPQFGGVKGKGGKKGGGMSSVVLALDEDADEGDDWRPSPEEYKKLSSKEKRQLRNKLSARAFRNRRKTYINELEDHIKDRDRLIDAIRMELHGSKSENDELRLEINALKKAALIPTPASLQKLTPRPSGANVNAEAGPSNYASRAPKAPTAALNKFNPNKDVSTSVFGALSPRTVKGFWNGANGLELPGGGFTSVHTAFTPDLRLPISPPMDPKPAVVNFTRVNLNPLITTGSPPRDGQQQMPKQSNASDLANSFEHWSTDNMFSHKTLDSYRMQIWSRMARQAALDRAGVSPEVRPMFLRESSASGKAESPRSLLREAKPSGRDLSVEVITVKAETTAVPPHIDQNAISSRLFAAFMSAFKSGTAKSNISNTGSGQEAVLSEKLSIADAPTRGLSVLDADAALAASFASLNMATESLGIKAVAVAPEAQERRSPLAFLGRA